MKKVSSFYTYWNCGLIHLLRVHGLFHEHVDEVINVGSEVVDKDPIALYLGYYDDWGQEAPEVFWSD